jgi:glutamine amidotransferase
VENKVTIIDYGMGNLWSVASAIKFLGADPVVSHDPIEIANSNCLVLPGVGSFRRAMETIKTNKYDQAIAEALTNSKTKLLGICLGMQLLGASSTEDGVTLGLGLVPNLVTRFSSNNNIKIKIPHIGFSEVKSPKNSSLFVNIPDNSCFYFVHSYFMEIANYDVTKSHVAIATHGTDFVAAIESGRICGTQFHPEKSQKSGLQLMRNFLERF